MADLKPQVAAAIRRHSEAAAQHGATILERADAIEAKLDRILALLERADAIEAKLDRILALLERPESEPAKPPTPMNAAVAKQCMPPQPQPQVKPSK